MAAVCFRGFISSLSLFTQQRAGASVAGIIMIIIGVMFAALAFLDMIMLIKVRTFSCSYSQLSHVLHVFHVMLVTGFCNMISYNYKFAARSF